MTVVMFSLFRSFRPIAATTALSVRRREPGVERWKTLPVQSVPSTLWWKGRSSLAPCRRVSTHFVLVTRVVVAVLVVLVILKGLMSVRLSITPTMSAVIMVWSGAPELL